MKFRGLLVAGGIAGGIAGGYWLVRYLQPRHSPLVLEGAVVVITGASSGIGYAYAMAFAKRGARLVITARRAERLEALRLAAEPYAADVLATPADLSDPDARAEIVNRALDYYGHIDVLINNAGVVIGGPLETNSLADISNIVEVNLTAAMAITRLALPSMLTRRAGLVINVASDAGRVATPSYSVYGATKHGLLGFSDALRRDLEGTGVQVVSVLPGWTRTEMISAKTLAWLHQAGEHVVEPELIAEGTIHGILNGQTELYFGGFMHRLGIWVEQHFPALMSLYWRAANSPQWIAAIRAENEDTRAQAG